MTSETNRTDFTAAPGLRLRATRQREGRTLRGLALDLGVSAATLSQVENGRTRLSVERLTLAAEVLNTSVSDILDNPDGTPRDDTDVSVPLGPSSSKKSDLHRRRPENWRDYPPLDVDPVLGAALDEFVQSGYHGTSVRDIAKRCGLSVSGIYHHYSSKQEMLTTLLRRTMRELLWRSEFARREGETPRQRFCLLVEHLALFHTYRRELGFIGAAEMRSLQPQNHQEIAGMRHTQQRMVDDEVEAAVAAGDIHTPYPHEAGRAVVTMCTALPTWFYPYGPLTPEQIAQQYVDFALDIMRSHPENQGELTEI